MLPTIGELIGKPSDKDVPLFGVEIEVEGTNLPNNVKGWAVVPEGSLRPVNGEQGKEYIFNRPYTLIESHKAIDSFVERMGTGNPIFSTRTSVHVHTDVRNLSIVHWFNLITLWGVFEDCLLDYCGEDRKGNLFCLSLRDAEGLIPTLRNVINEKSLRYAENNVRYSAINIAATRKFGSLEFRCMRGTADPDILHNWVNIIHTLRIMAERFNSPEEILEQVIMDPMAFAKRMEWENESIVLENTELVRTMREAAYRLIFLFDNVNWDTFVFHDEPFEDQ